MLERRETVSESPFSLYSTLSILALEATRLEVLEQHAVLSTIDERIFHPSPPKPGPEGFVLPLESAGVAQGGNDAVEAVRTAGAEGIADPAEELLRALDGSLEEKPLEASPFPMAGAPLPGPAPRPVAELFQGLDAVYFATPGGGPQSSAGGSDTTLFRALVGGGGIEPSGGGRPSGGGIMTLDSGSGGGGTATAQAAPQLYVLQWTDGLVLFEGVADHEKAGEWVDLRAQVRDGEVQSYSWDVSAAPDATNVSGTNDYRLKFQWSTSIPMKVTEQVTLTVTLTDGTQLSETLTFVVEPAPNGGGGGGSGGGYGGGSGGSGGGGGAPSVSWPVVLEPGQLASGQDAVTGSSVVRPYRVELADGSVEFGWAMPSYNPGVAPAGLIYDSVAAEPDPILMVRYELDPQGMVPDQVAARLTLDGVSGSWIYYDTSMMNPGDVLELALQADTTGVATGRYPYTVEVVPYYGGMPGMTETFSGETVIVSQEGSEFGEGWSLAGLDRLVPVSGGVILARADGSALWYADDGQGGYVSPPGDFATLVRNGDGSYTRTLKTGERQEFTTTGLLAAVVDRNGNTVSFAYTDADGDGVSDEIASITDPNGLQTVFGYDAAGHVVSITDPAGRTAQLAYNTAGQLVRITAPDGAQWGLSYASDGRLTSFTDPLNRTTQVSYGKGNRVSSVVRPDGTSRGFEPLVTAGLAGSGEGTPSSPVPAVLLAEAVAAYVDPMGGRWEDRLDWYGFGLVVQATDAIGTSAGPAGHMSMTERNGDGLPVLSADRLGRKTEWSYDDSGNVVGMTLPDGARWQYSYDTNNLLIQETDPLGRVTDYVRDANGNLVQLVLPDPDGSGPQPRPVYAYGYTSDGWLISVTDPLGRVTQYERDSRDRVIRTILPDDDTDPANNPTIEQGWDNASNLVWVIDERGYRTEMTYDVMGRPVRTTYPDDDADPSNNPFATVTYDVLGNVISTVDENGHETRFEYDQLNRPVRRIDPDDDADPANNPVWETVYNAADEVIATIDPLGRQTQYGYNELGYQTSVTTPLGYTTVRAYDAEGQLLSLTDPLGRQTQWQYDERGRVVKVIDAAGQEQDFQWDAVDRLITMTDASGGTTTRGYDDLDRVVWVKDPLGNQWNYEYDLVGNRTATVDPLGNRWERDYDARNRVIAERDPLGNETQYVYCTCGSLESVVDPLGRETRFAYNARGWRTEVILPDGDGDPSNNPRIRFGYDAEGNLTSLTDADGNTTRWVRNARDEVIEEINALGLSRYFEVNPAGELTAVVDRNGRRREFTYDADGRRTAEKWLDGQGQVVFQINYSWDGANQLIAVSDPNQTYAFSYDVLGRVETLDNAGSPAIYPHVVLANQYDANGNRTQLSDNYGTEWKFAHDALNRLAQASLVVSGATKAVADFTYDSAGRLVQVKRYQPGTGGSGGQPDPLIITTYGYDAASRVTSIEHVHRDSQGVTTPLMDFAYTWDAASQIVQYVGPEGVRNYAYDPQGQLTDVTDGYGNVLEYYRYTPNGNRTESHLHGTGYVTGADNRLLSDGTNDYAYDNEGNLVRKTNTVTGEVTEYTWDYRNRLTDVVHRDAGGNVLWEEHYVYDAFNRRIAFRVDPDGPNGPEPESFTFVLHDLQQPPTAAQVAQGGLAPYVDGIYESAIFAANPLADFIDADTSDGITPQLTERRLYAEAIDALLARENAVGEILFDLTDHLGSIRGWVEPDGTLVESLAYESFGLPVGGWTSESRFGYTGREWSEEAALFALRARNYDPAAGRFLSQDPVAFIGGRELYAYGENRATASTDRLGLHPTGNEGIWYASGGNASGGRPAWGIWEWLRKFLKEWKKAKPIAERIKEVLKPYIDCASANLPSEDGCPPHITGVMNELRRVVCPQGLERPADEFACQTLARLLCALQKDAKGAWPNCAALVDIRRVILAIPDFKEDLIELAEECRKANLLRPNAPALEEGCNLAKPLAGIDVGRRR